MSGIYEWADCAIAGCPRKSCLALSSIYCFPHTDGNEHVKRWKINARNCDSDGTATAAANEDLPEKRDD